MKALLTTTAVIEVAAGVGLIAAPEILAWILLGASIGTAAGVIVARLAGVAVLSLTVACWFGSRDARSRAAFGVVAAMLLYNLGAVALFLAARYGAGLSGIALLPATLLHAVMAVWCIASLRSPRS